MAITIEVGTNSYITYDDAVTFFEERLWSDKWNNATEEDRKRAMVGATKRLEREKYYGSRLSTTQKLSFPRVGIGYLDGILLDNIIPEQIKEAQLETAIFMMSNDITRKDVNTGDVQSVKVGSIGLDFVKDSTPSISSFNELPDYVLTLLDDFSTTASSGGWVQVSR